jgi:hypothetical protein
MAETRHAARVRGSACRNASAMMQSTPSSPLRPLYHPWSVMLALSLAVTATVRGAAVEISWSGATTVAEGHGEVGPWQQNESAWDYLDDPTVALAPDRSLAVAWVDQGAHDVVFQWFSPDNQPRFERPVNVSRSGEIFSWLPRMVLDPGDPAVVSILWQEIIFSGGSHGGDILFAHSRDGGRTFGQPLNLSQSISGDGKGRITAEVWHNGSHDLVRAPDGTLYAAWTAYEGPLWFSRSQDNGASFSPPRQIAGDHRRPARAPSLAVAPSGRVWLAWTVGEDRSADLRVGTSDDGGASFSEPQRVLTGPGYADAPKLVVDESGGVHLVYSESEGPFGQPHVRYARSGVDEVRFGASRRVSDPLPSGMDAAGFPSVALDGAGGIYVVFELFPNGSRRPHGLGYILSTDHGRSFSPPRVVPHSVSPLGPNGSRQGHLMEKLAVNASGALAVANAAIAEGRASRVWYIRGQHGQPDALDPQP